jgi:hypothetical protein
MVGRCVRVREDHAIDHQLRTHVRPGQANVGFALVADNVGEIELLRPLVRLSAKNHVAACGRWRRASRSPRTFRVSALRGGRSHSAAGTRQ